MENVRTNEEYGTMMTAVRRYLAVAAFAFGLVWVSAVVPCEARAATPSESHPARVRVGLQIHNLGGIDEVNERWEVTGTIVASWRDRSLAYRPHNAADRDREVTKSIWRPILVFRNEITESSFRNPDIYADPDGAVIYTQDFNAALSTDLDLRRFPFDSENLPIIVEPAGPDAQRVVLEYDPKLSMTPNARYSELGQWKILGLTAHPDTESLANRSNHGIAFLFQVQRMFGSYVWKFIVPLILLVMISWISFWLSPEEFTTKDQFSASIATLLIIVAYNLVASNLLPKTNYITYIDALLFVSFAFVIIAIGFIVGIHLQRRSPGNAQRLRRVAAITLPLAFLITQVFLVVSFRI